MDQKWKSEHKKWLCGFDTSDKSHRRSAESKYGRHNPTNSKKWLYNKWSEIFSKSWNTLDYIFSIFFDKEKTDNQRNRHALTPEEIWNPIDIYFQNVFCDNVVESKNYRANEHVNKCTIYPKLPIHSGHAQEERGKYHNKKSDVHLRWKYFSYDEKSRNGNK